MYFYKTKYDIRDSMPVESLDDVYMFITQTTGHSVCLIIQYNVSQLEETSLESFNAKTEEEQFVRYTCCCTMYFWK